MLRALLLCLVALPLSAAEWLPDLDAAKTRARAERKAIIVYRPSRAAESDLLKKAEAETAIAHALESFVLVRMFGSGATLALLDPDGKEVATPDSLRNLNSFAAFLVAARDASGEIVRSSELRRSGNAGAADYFLGRALMTLGLFKRAATHLEKTANSLRDAGDSEHAALAQAYAAMSFYLSGQKNRGETMLNQVLRNARTPAVQAEARYLQGSIASMERDYEAAKRHWRKAYELAAPGSVTARTVRAALESVDEKPIRKDAVPGSGSLRLVTPARKVVVGKVEFEAIPSVPAASVQFFIDDVPALTVEQPPYRARIDVGNTPRPRTVKAIAFDEHGSAVAEAVTTINDRADAFRVSITSPVEQFVNGSVVVEADADVPQGSRLVKLELFWNGERLASFSAPPFRHMASLPDQFGYVRAVGTLDDGRTAEAIRLLNVAASEAVEVQGVTLSVVVTDGRGNRVSGLKQSDLVVEEDGASVRFSMREDESEPALIGLAIDVSSSMRQSMLQAFRYADSFIASGAGNGDRLFAVAFDATPRLIQGATDDADRLRKAVMSLRPAGGTSMFDGIAFALQQFEGTSGKRALVVISDGKEVRSSSSAAACLRLAQQVGVPIYAVSMSARPNALYHLASETGGMWIPAPRGVDLSAVFARVRDEVRGQYLITFVSPKTPVSGAWHDVRVKVKDARVKTVAGYRVP